MPPVTEVRIAVGTPTGRRSTVWKFYVRKCDVYIQTRMFGADAKVSLHASGDCQWSATDVWVKRDSGRRNADRHITKWHVPRPSGSSATQIFRVMIPESELRVVGTQEKLNCVQWLPAPPAGLALVLECYVTPFSAADPALTSRLPHSHLFSLPLSDGRWFTVLQHALSVSGGDLEILRAAIIAQAGIEPKDEYRMAAFSVQENGPRGLIELCAVAGL